jgi:hypothetical protein
LSNNEAFIIKGGKAYPVDPPKYWARPPVILPVTAWVADVLTGLSTAVVPGPTFDFRPDLNAKGSPEPIGRVLMHPGAVLYVQLSGLLNGSTTQEMKVFYREFAHISDARQVVAASYPSVTQITGDIEATSAIIFGTSQTDSVILPFAPQGGESCPRFWRLELRFTVPTPAALPAPVLTIEMAAY